MTARLRLNNHSRLSHRGNQTIASCQRRHPSPKSDRCYQIRANLWPKMMDWHPKVNCIQTARDWAARRIPRGKSHQGQRSAQWTTTSSHRCILPYQSPSYHQASKTPKLKPKSSPSQSNRLNKLPWKSIKNLSKSPPYKDYHHLRRRPRNQMSRKSVRVSSRQIVHLKRWPRLTNPRSWTPSDPMKLRDCTHSLRRQTTSNLRRTSTRRTSAALPTPRGPPWRRSSSTPRHKARAKRRH